MKKTSYLLCFLGVNAVWLLLSRLLSMKALPSPLKVYTSVRKAYENDILWHICSSSFRVLIAFIIALLIALVLGLAMGYSKGVNRYLAPVIYLSYPIPKLALMPVVMIFAGIGDISKIIIIVIIIVFQMIVSIRDAAIAVPAETYDILTTLRANLYDKFRHITIPAILPAIFSSIRVSVGTAISVLMIAESFGTDKGLGFYIIDTWMRADYVQMYVGILCLSAIGFVIFICLDAFEGRVCGWQEQAHA